MKVKNINKYADKAIKKVPKKKLINKAATYGVKQLVGGPYLDLITLFFNTTKKKALSYAGSYAYDSFFRSNFAREKINSVPIAVVALIIRMIVNFLIISKLKTKIYLIDFTISMIVTIIINLLAPIFYKSIDAHREAFMKYTNIFVDNFLGLNGWEYVENIKNQLVLSAGIIVIIILYFVKINSTMVQEMVIHTLITGYITDRIFKWLENLPPDTFLNLSKVRQLYYGLEYINAKGDYIEPIILPCRKFKKCHTKNRVFLKLNPHKAKVITHDEIIEMMKHKKKR